MGVRFANRPFLLQGTMPSVFQSGVAYKNNFNVPQLDQPVPSFPRVPHRHRLVYSPVMQEDHKWNGIRQHGEPQ